MKGCAYKSVLIAALISLVLLVYDYTNYNAIYVADIIEAVMNFAGWLFILLVIAAIYNKIKSRKSKPPVNENKQ